MKSLLVIGLFLDLVGVVILGMRDVMKGAASLRSLRESYKDSLGIRVRRDNGASVRYAEGLNSSKSSVTLSEH